jgi:hypothetical protein
VSNELLALTAVSVRFGITAPENTSDQSGNLITLPYLLKITVWFSVQLRSIGMADIQPESAPGAALPANKTLEKAMARDYPSIEVSDEKSTSATHDGKYEEIDERLQSGVRAVEAAASVWGRPHLISAFVMQVVPESVS